MIAPNIPLAPDVLLRRPRSQVEAALYNQGIVDMLTIAASAAAAIASTSHRRVHEDFAIAALDELARVGQAMLIGSTPQQMTPSNPQAPTSVDGVDRG